MYRLATCFWVSLRTLSPQGLSIAPSRVSSCKNVFHTLSYRFDAIISLKLYSCGKGKGMNDCVQGGIADTLTLYIRVFKAAKPLQPFSQPFILVDTQEKSG